LKECLRISSEAPQFQLEATMVIQKALSHRFVAFVILIVAVVGSPGAALAKASPSGSGNNCVARLEYVQAGGPEGRVVSETCFPTFAEAISYATDGQTALGADTRPDALTEGMLPDGIQTDYVLGIDWDFINYTGNSKVWTASNGCDFSHWWTLSYVGDGWNDRTESAKGFSGCVHYRHFDAINFGVPVLTCNPNCATMGSMTDKTSSEQFDD
jgi:hypothetical protein